MDVISSVLREQRLTALHPKNIDSDEALDWVKDENQRTVERFDTESFRRDRDEVNAALDRPENLPSIVRRGGLMYDYWTDEAHPRGIWRRTTLECLRAGEDI